VEVDDHYEPPAAEAGACKAVQRDTQWKSARSDTERLLARFVLTLSGSAAGFPVSGPTRVPHEHVGHSGYGAITRSGSAFQADSPQCCRVLM